MKKIILTAVVICNFAYAGVMSTSIGCENKEDLINLTNNVKLNGNDVQMDELYKYLIENNCEIINPKDKITQQGKPTEDGFLRLYVEKYDKYLFIKNSKVKDNYTPTNNKLNRSF